MLGRERPILYIFEELVSKDAKFLGQKKHYLNNLIGDAQWEDMFIKAKKKDADYEILNAQPSVAFPEFSDVGAPGGNDADTFDPREFMDNDGRVGNAEQKR